MGREELKPLEDEFELACKASGEAHLQWLEAHHQYQDACLRNEGYELAYVHLKQAGEESRRRNLIRDALYQNLLQEYLDRSVQP